MLRRSTFGVLFTFSALAPGAILSQPLARPIKAPAALIVDGDTIDLVDEVGGALRLRRIRFWGIDTPEHGEPGYAEASARLALLLAERRGVSCVAAEQADQRAGRRLVATCWAGPPRALRESLNCRLIAAGVAREMRRFSDGALAMCRR